MIRTKFVAQKLFRSKCNIFNISFFMNDNLTFFPTFLGSFTSRSSSNATPFYGSVDGNFEKERIVKQPGESNTRDFTYFMLGNKRIVYASAVRLALIKVNFLL